MERMATMESKSKEMMQKAKEKGKQVAESAKGRFEKAVELPEKAPPPVYEGLTLASIIASIVLFSLKKKETAIFVGLWAPTFLALGIFGKTVGLTKEK